MFVHVVVDYKYKTVYPKLEHGAIVLEGLRVVFQDF